MEWTKKIGSRAAADGGWRDDFPLSHDLPRGLEVNCSDLRLPIHPMFALRLRVFLEWHRQEGREVQVVPPVDSTTNKVFRQLRIAPGLAIDEAENDQDTILPVTHLTNAEEVEDIARQTREILEYQLTDVSPLGQAAFMAVAELCDNAIDHAAEMHWAPTSRSVAPLSRADKSRLRSAIWGWESPSTSDSGIPNGAMTATQSLMPRNLT